LIQLIVALGNPGSKYEQTRHNIGWLLMDQIVDAASPTWIKKFKGEYCKIQLGGKSVYCLKPHTYMNLSGESVLACAQFFKIPMENTLVLHDELDLAYGQIMLKDGGGNAGHNGLKSIQACTGTDKTKRMRLGIGRPAHGNVSGYVLSSFTNDEWTQFEDYVANAGDVVEKTITQDFKKVQNQYNKKMMINT
jgi:PTH1 family peptidyl-tRNA hydrolase